MDSGRIEASGDGNMQGNMQAIICKCKTIRRFVSINSLERRDIIVRSPADWMSMRGIGPEATGSAYDWRGTVVHVWRDIGIPVDVQMK